MHYSMSTHIHDFQCANKMSVNELYWLLGCAVCAVSRCSIFWVAKVRPLWGTSMQPQLGMFITRPSSFKIDAKELLSTNGTIYKQRSNPHLHYVQWQPYALQIKQIRNLPRESFPRCSCTVTYAFHDSSKTLLIICDLYLRKGKIPFLWRFFWSEYPNPLSRYVPNWHHLSSRRNHACRINYTLITEWSENTWFIPENAIWILLWKRIFTYHHV